MAVDLGILLIELDTMIDNETDVQDAKTLAECQKLLKHVRAFTESLAAPEETTALLDYITLSANEKKIEEVCRLLSSYGFPALSERFNDTFTVRTPSQRIAFCGFSDGDLGADLFVNDGAFTDGRSFDCVATGVRIEARADILAAALVAELMKVEEERHPALAGVWGYVQNRES